MRKAITLILMLVLAAISYHVNAQAGTLDFTFNPGIGFNNTVYATKIQNDGKILIGGNFTSFNGTARNRIARLNSDGSIDVTFNPGTGANAVIWSIDIQSDGKLIIGGDFTSFNGTARNYIARLNSDGSLDASFNPGTGANSEVWTTVIQSDGKIIIGGEFTTYNGSTANHIARLNSNGSLDATFNSGSGASSFVYASTIQSDGKIIIGGGFTTYNGTARNYIARINSDGTLDATFNPGTGTNTSIRTLAVQSDGKIMIGGEFTTYNGTARNRIARSNSDGSLDVTFNPGTGTNAPVRTIAMQSDGKIIIGGEFVTYNGTTRNNIARINSDGSLDATFNPGTGSNMTIRSVSIQVDGKIIIGGGFSLYNGTSINRIARILASGVGIIEHLNLNNIGVFPNPALGIIYINFKEYTGDIIINIVNTKGIVVFSEVVSPLSDNYLKQLDISDFPNGLYLLKINNNGKTFTERIVKL